MIKRVVLITGSIVIGLLAILLLVAVFPLGADLESDPQPVAGYDEAVQRIDAIIADEEERVCDECRTRFYTHGKKTEKAVLLIHGLTNSPRQFVELGQEFYDDGYNVLIMRMPYHGLKSHDVGELAQVKAEDLSRYADEAVDITAGLGEEVTVAGLSGGGTVTGWIAQNRVDVDRAVLIAPFFGIHGVPGFADTMFINLFARLPNFNFISPSEMKREHVYAGEATRGMAQYLLLGKVTREQADEAPPAVKDIVIITNNSDSQVNNGITHDLAATWEGAGAVVTSYAFDKSLDLPHDVIDVSTIGDRSSITYPVIIQLIEAEA